MHGGRAALKGVHHLEISRRILAGFQGFNTQTAEILRCTKTTHLMIPGGPPFGEPPGIIDFLPERRRAMRRSLCLRDELLVGVGLEPLHGTLVAIAAFLDAAERRLGHRDGKRIDTDHA